MHVLERLSDLAGLNPRSTGWSPLTPDQDPGVGYCVLRRAEGLLPALAPCRKSLFEERSSCRCSNVGSVMIPRR